MVGYKVDFSENAGLHLLVSVADELIPDFTGRLQITQIMYPDTTLRIWLGHFMLQETYFDKTHFIGVGFIGFTK